MQYVINIYTFLCVMFLSNVLVSMLEEIITDSLKYNIQIIR